MKIMSIRVNNFHLDATMQYCEICQKKVYYVNMEDTHIP